MQFVHRRSSRASVALCILDMRSSRPCDASTAPSTCNPLSLRAKLSPRTPRFLVLALIPLKLHLTIVPSIQARPQSQINRHRARNCTLIAPLRHTALQASPTRRIAILPTVVPILLPPPMCQCRTGCYLGRPVRIRAARGRMAVHIRHLDVQRLSIRPAPLGLLLPLLAVSRFRTWCAGEVIEERGLDAAVDRHVLGIVSSSIWWGASAVRDRMLAHGAVVHTVPEMYAQAMFVPR